MFKCLRDIPTARNRVFLAQVCCLIQSLQQLSFYSSFFEPQFPSSQMESCSSDFFFFFLRTCNFIDDYIEFHCMVIHLLNPSFIGGRVKLYTELIGRVFILISNDSLRPAIKL